jgi:DNA-directed RNA polymerase subunit RPC12/RpoP
MIAVLRRALHWVSCQTCGRSYVVSSSRGGTCPYCGTRF